ncbi:hypothetical protein [Paraburkholderia rhizosphaerae]|uniref:Uncharacterized protein n=1 Tax=Paraburkholderia rhizosphaerae TaxID=480658 RepID=A0A4R8M4G3_9BURK|nr:hypothetical protein [Paraburkholderia rhizosphaerae]TDY54911.1 hypothetical protein BX592_101367 [Paraburkholderia rhizosphaerae]
MNRFAVCVGSVIVTLFAATFANAALRYDWDEVLLPQAAVFPKLSRESEQRYFDQMFREQGIEPDSNKAQIVRAWINKIRQDPIIAAAVPGGAKGIGRLFLDTQTRESLLLNGLVRLSAADRLSYVQLLSKFLDELVPVDCFGLLNMNDVMSRISLREMSDSDVAQYFNLLSKVLVSDAVDAPIVLPTREQYTAAKQQFADALFVQLSGDQSDITRFQHYSAHPAQATPSDACWVTRVTMHAILSMPDPGRDYILLISILQSGEQAKTQAGDPAPSEARPAAPSPASAQPPGGAPGR